nr:hypothetical protein [Actinomycetes bacterium]
MRWAAQQVSKHSIRGLPVLPGETMVGFVGVGDIAGFFDADDWRATLSARPTATSTNPAPGEPARPPGTHSASLGVRPDSESS